MCISGDIQYSILRTKLRTKLKVSRSANVGAPQRVTRHARRKELVKGGVTESHHVPVALDSYHTTSVGDHGPRLSSLSIGALR